MLVRHTMTPNPFTVSPDDLCFDTLRVMRARRFRHAPVVDEGKLVGLVSERDLLRALPHLVESFEGKAGEESLAATVRSVMNHRPIHCSSSDPVDLVARQMLKRRLGCMAVVADGELIGIVTTNDLLRGFTDHLGAKGSSALTLVWTKGGIGTSPEVTAFAAEAGMHVDAYFVTETNTGALAIMVRVSGGEAEHARFIEKCIGAGLLLMASSKAA